MIDLHCHLLPAVDDGSRSVEQSVAVLRDMARHEVSAVCLTPHLLASQLNRGIPEAYDRAFEALRDVAPPLPALYRGLEVMLDGPLEAAVGAGRRGTLAGSRYILVEFPLMVARAAVQQALTDVLSVGLIPLVAHPERYKCCAPETVRAWRLLGARMQIDATTLRSSRSRGNRARVLVALGLADIIAADNHGDGRLISTGFHLLARHDGMQAELLTDHNPRRILADEDLLPVPPLPLENSWWQWIRSMFDKPGG